MYLDFLFGGIFLVFLFFVIRSFWTIVSFAPWVPVLKKDYKRIFDLANLKPGEIFYDLGCGDGRIVGYASSHFSGVAIGVELQFPLFVVCKIRQLLLRNKNLFFKNKNLFDEDLSKADVVYVFGIPRTLAHKVKEKFQKELKPGARVISYLFSIEGFVPESVSRPLKSDNSIYVYQF
jgi:hypothetical protein